MRDLWQLLKSMTDVSNHLLGAVRNQFLHSVHDTVEAISDCW